MCARSENLFNSGLSLPTVLAVFYCLNSPFSKSLLLGGRRIQYPCGNNPSRLLTAFQPPNALI
nr:MAG TPA: hypothetical protein [Caudoviricetes sp.]